MRIAVFASGGGSNFQCLLDRVSSGELDVEFAFLLVNNSKCGAVQKAEKAGIKVLHISSKTHGSNDSAESAIVELIKAERIDMIVLAGYMKKLPIELVRKMENKILNIHPALLPAFGGKGMYGMNVHNAVVQMGAQYSGVTIHLVSENYDEGPIVFQDIVKVGYNDSAETVAGNVLAKEHDNYWKVLQGFSQKQITIVGRKVLWEK